MFFIFISQKHDHEVCLNFDIVVPYDNDIVLCCVVVKSCNKGKTLCKYNVHENYDK